jgi:hypothetical protein
MRATTGTLDEARLTQWVSGDPKDVLGEIEAGESASIAFDAGEPVDLDAPLRAGVWVARAPGQGRVAVAAHRDSIATRWVHVGTIVRGESGSRVDLVFESAQCVHDWYPRERSSKTLGHGTGGFVRLVRRTERGTSAAILLKGGDRSICVFAGFDDRNVVAFVLDAEALAGIRDDCDEIDAARATCAMIAEAQPGAIALLAHARFAPAGGAGIVATERANVHLAGTLSLPSRTIALELGWFVIDGRRVGEHAVAGDGVEVLVVETPRRGMIAWVLRVPSARPTAWADAFFEDTCHIGDAAACAEGFESIGAEPRAHRDLGFHSTASGARFLCVDGPDLSTARGFVGLDEDRRMTTLVVLT